MSWHKKGFTITLEYAKSEVAGWVSNDGLWGIRVMMDGWGITHLQTGRSVGRESSTLIHCKIVCDELSKRPGLWRFGEFGLKPMLTQRQKTIRKNVIEKAFMDAA